MAMRHPLDSTDYLILDFLQRDETVPIDQIAAAARLSESACWKRIQMLHKRGFIEKTVALLSPEALGLQVTAVTMIAATRKSEGWTNTVARDIGKMPETVELYRTSDDVDLVVISVVRDEDAFRSFEQEVARLSGEATITTMLLTDRIKTSTQLPL